MGSPQVDITQYFHGTAYTTGTQQNFKKYYQTLSINLSNELPAGPEKSVALRKLLESFDAAMRSSA